LRLSVTTTVLYFVVIPAAIVFVVAGLALRGGRVNPDRRYRPGRPFDLSPIWFISSPEQGGTPTRSALPEGGRTPVQAGDTETGRTRPGLTGGASDRW